MSLDRPGIKGLGQSIPRTAALCGVHSLPSKVITEMKSGGAVLGWWARYLLNIRCLSRQPRSTPPYFGYRTLLPSRAVKLGNACRLCLGSGHLWGVKREKGGQVVTGLWQRACCSRRYSVMMLSRVGGEGRWRSCCFFIAGVWAKKKKQDRINVFTVTFISQTNTMNLWP